MKVNTRTSLVLLLAVLCGRLSPTAVFAQTAPTPEQRVAALKQSLADSHARLLRYEWIETTIISLKGEEKARKQQRCYYGAYGKLQKLPVGDAPEAQPAASGGGRRGGRVKAKVVENKKDEMKEYMERAAALIHQYVPPQPEHIQKAKDGGTLSIAPLDQGRVRLTVPGYLQAGDQLTVDVNAAANTLVGVNVATYLDKPDDTVTLDVRFAALDDGTRYTAKTTLDAKAKNIRVVVENTGYRPMTP